MPIRYVTTHPEDWAASPAPRRGGREARQQTVRNLGGGEVCTLYRDGKRRDPDRMLLGNDPNPPRDDRY